MLEASVLDGGAASLFVSDSGSLVEKSLGGAEVAAPFEWEANEQGIANALGVNLSVGHTASIAQREAIAKAAREWVGTPFVWEASLKGKGCDCRGLLTGIARDCGRPEASEIEANVVGYSRRIDEQALLVGLDRVFVRKEGEPQPGDVLAFRIQRRVQHLALYLGEGRMVHAYSGDPAQVIEARLGAFWRNRLAGVWGWHGR